MEKINSPIIELLIDEFGEYEVMIFCELYTRFCELSNFTGIEDIDFDVKEYKRIAKILKDGIKQGQKVQ